MNTKKNVFFAFLSFGMAMIIAACLWGSTPVLPLPDGTMTPGTQDILSKPDSLTVTGAEAGEVTSASGVILTIPAGAVPANDDGSIGSTIFSIQVDTTTVPSLPGGYVPVGPVVNLGPEGFVFELPVTISIPISAGIDPATVMGASYYDTGQGVWLLVPGSVDQTQRTVEVSTTHLSLWTIWALNPEISVDNSYGYFRIARPGAGLPYTGPNADYNGAWTSHGICVSSATFTNPEEADYWAKADNLNFATGNYWGAPYADDREPFGLFRVPTGSYNIIEYVGQSEVNPIDPGYTPHAWEQWRNAGTFIVAGNQIVGFPDAVWGYNTHGWTLGRPPCWETVTHPGEQVNATETIPSTTVTAPSTEALCNCDTRWWNEVQLPNMRQATKNYLESQGDVFVSLDIEWLKPFEYNPSTQMCEGELNLMQCQIFQGTSTCGLIGGSGEPRADDLDLVRVRCAEVGSLK